MVYNKKIIRAVTVSMSTVFYVDMIPELKNRGYTVVSVSSPGPELQKVSEKGAKVIEVPMERHISVTKDIKALFQLIRVFRHEKPYMVHSMTPKAGLLCMMAAWLCRVPRRVHTFTGLVWPTCTGYKRKILMLTDWITCFCATHIIPEGQGVMDDLHQHITNKPMKVLGYGNVKGINLEYWCITPKLKAKSLQLSEKWWLGNRHEHEKLFTFLFVGRLVGDKGINELVEAFLKLREFYLHQQNGQKVRLVLVGMFEDSLDPISDLTKQRIDATPSIIYAGEQYGDTLLTYYAAVNCFVMPSYREGFPNTVIEAGAMGLPSVVSNINGSREIIEDGKNGIIIPSRNADALYDAMKQMVDNQSMYQQMAENARPMIASRFEQGFVRKCLFDFYDEIKK